MYKTLMIALVLLVSAAWLQAQAYPQSEPSQSARAGQMSGQTTVEGCLQGSDGNYTLTDKNGTMYQLSGDTAKLAEHVGHEVQITGSTSGSNSMSPSGTAGSQQNTLDVKSMKHISKTCKTAK